MNSGRSQEAKGIFIRHQLKLSDFNNYMNGAMQKNGKEIESLKYDSSKDFKVPKDMFEPKSTPYKEYLCLPNDIDV